MTNEYLNFTVSLAREAGEIIRHNFGIGGKTEWKSDNSPITTTDLAVNELVITTVRKAYPTHSILGEEGSFVVEGSNLTWVCDPVDGTTPFSLGMPLSTFSLALVEDGVSIVGVIYDPFTDRMYTAIKGGGAFLNGERISVSTRNTFEHAHFSCESRKFFPLMLPLMEQGAKVLRLYCVTCPGVLIACGEFDGAMHGGPYPWDIAALKVIIEEAGGRVTDIHGNEQRYDGEIKGAIVSNGLLHDRLVKMVKELC